MRELCDNSPGCQCLAREKQAENSLVTGSQARKLQIATSFKLLEHPHERVMRPVCDSFVLPLQVFERAEGQATPLEEKLCRDMTY